MNDIYKSRRIFYLLGIFSSLLQFSFPTVVNAQLISKPDNCQGDCLRTAGFKRNYSQNIFKGTWNAEGYQCPLGVYRREIISIQVNENLLMAMKLDGDGDLCVPTGSMTFSALLPNEITVGIPFPINFIAGTPDNPASTTVPGQITIVDENTFYAEGTYGQRLTFRRVQGD